VSNSLIKQQKELNTKLDALASQMMRNDAIFNNHHLEIYEHTDEVCQPRMF